MWGKMVIGVVAAAAAIVVWYLLLRRANRRHAAHVVDGIRAALAGKGEVVAVRWRSASLFQVVLRLGTSLFRHPALVVRLVPRENPLRWLRQWWRREPATITFEADFDSAPGFNLQVQQHRWSARSSKRISPGSEGWQFEQVTPLILTSSRTWQREVASMMNALLSCREREVLGVGFRRTSPHFSATIALECFSPEGRGGSNLFDTIRELAAGASAPRL